MNRDDDIEASRLSLLLYHFLDKHGEDGDDYSEIYAALEAKCNIRKPDQAMIAARQQDRRS